jgi:hypothetical protein
LDPQYCNNKIKQYKIHPHHIQLAIFYCDQIQEFNTTVVPLMHAVNKQADTSSFLIKAYPMSPHLFEDAKKLLF